MTDDVRGIVECLYIVSLLTPPPPPPFWPGCGGEGGLRPAAAVPCSLWMEAHVCLTHTHRQDQQVQMLLH